MRVLLTGASGNLGQQLVNQAEIEIIQLKRSDWPMLGQKLDMSVDVVVHAASDLRTNVCDSPSQLMDSNLMTTMRLLEAMRDKKIPRFIFISSCAVYGDSVDTYEGNECKPCSINGISKHLNEAVIQEFCSAHGIKFEIYRVFNMYGGNDHFSVLNHLQKAANNESCFILKNRGIAQRDFIHVADVALIILDLLKMNVPFTHLNIGTGIATKISTLLSLVVKGYPKMMVETEGADEIEYSRADITKLRSLLDVNFLDVKEFVSNDFSLLKTSKQ